MIGQREVDLPMAGIYLAEVMMGLGLIIALSSLSGLVVLGFLTPSNYTVAFATEPTSCNGNGRLTIDSSTGDRLHCATEDTQDDLSEEEARELLGLASKLAEDGGLDDKDQAQIEQQAAELTANAEAFWDQGQETFVYTLGIGIALLVLGFLLMWLLEIRPERRALTTQEPARQPADGDDRAV